MPSFAESFKAAYLEKYELFLRSAKQIRRINELEEQKALIAACISKCSANNSAYPIILGNSLYRVSISDIGTFPPYKYTERMIYPLKYTCKKRYKQHDEYRKAPKDRVVYVCSIEADGFKIMADDGRTWSGESCWQQFCESTGCDKEYKSIEEFVGLTHPAVTKLIENIGDVTAFPGYIPLEKQQ